MAVATFSSLKKQTLSKYKGNWGKIIRANILPIIPQIFWGFAATSVVIGLAIVLSHANLLHSVQQMMNDQTTTSSSGGYGSSRSVMSFLEATIGAFLTVGISYGTLDLLRGKSSELGFKTPFQTFTRKYFVSTLAIYVITFIFQVLWTLLLIIPGVIKQYAYSQSYLLFKDAKELGKDDNFEFVNFITFSRRLMDGNKWRLFLLQLSLLGWWILGMLTFGLGMIFYVPYRNGVYTSFYNDLVEQQGSEKVPELFA